MNRLYFVRHGENRANLTREFSHRMVDYSLTPKGRLQAEQAAAYFAARKINEVYASPLKRARETAEIIAAAHGLQVILLEELREINIGALEGRPPTDADWVLYNQIVAEWLEGRGEAAFPGGEDYTALWNRTRAALRQMFEGKSGREVVLVGHGGMLVATLKDICRNVTVDWLHDADSHNCAITDIRIEVKDGQINGELVTWAAHDHLYGAAAEFVTGIPRPLPSGHNE
jgi:probable phosphoglycerate mutase